jgi:NADH:ubiquinone oxidoreductase subunit 6 (subunit J)
LFLFTSFIFIFFEFEFLGLIFATVYVGGIAVMFLFLILTVDVRVENNEKVFIWKQMVLSKLIFSIVLSIIFSFAFLYFCDPLMFASVDFYLYCNKKIIFA